MLQMFSGPSKHKFGVFPLKYLLSYSTFNSGTGFKSNKTETEQKLEQLLKVRFPKASQIYVADVSGGCGAMFDVTVITAEFKDLSMVKQHRLVNDALKDEIKQMHGLRISTYDETIHKDKS